MRNLTKHTAKLVLLGLALIAVGCASGGGGAAAPAGPSDEEMIQTLITSALDALGEKDIATMTSNFADDLTTNQGQDKEALIQFLNQANEQGFLDGMTIDTSGMTTTIDGDTAEVAGVGLEGAFGALTLGFKLEKRDGQWLVTYQEQN